MHGWPRLRGPSMVRGEIAVHGLRRRAWTGPGRRLDCPILVLATSVAVEIGQSEGDPPLQAGRPPGRARAAGAMARLRPGGCASSARKTSQRARLFDHPLQSRSRLEPMLGSERFHDLRQFLERELLRRGGRKKGERSSGKGLLRPGTRVSLVVGRRHGPAPVRASGGSPTAPQRGREARAARTRRPISSVPTRMVPSLQMSGVR